MRHTPAADTLATPHATPEMLGFFFAAMLMMLRHTLCFSYAAAASYADIYCSLLI